MLIAIAGNANGRGLQKDYQLLKPILESLGHETAFVQYDAPHDGKYELVLCLEVISRHLVAMSELPPILIANPEWITPASAKIVERSYQAVFCKTHEAHRICTELFGDKARYTGFISEDRFLRVERKPVFLHIAGQSKAKNTEAILDAWRWNKNGEPLNAKLIIVSDFPMDLPANVVLLDHVPDHELRLLQNECLFHLQPSATEGWSHVLHESLSVGANILSVAAPPMNELDSVYLIQPSGHTFFNKVKMYEVSALDVYEAVLSLQRLGQRGFAQSGAPRREFMEGNASFKKLFAEELEKITTPRERPQGSVAVRPRSGAPSIAFIGNFDAEHSTENQILWALEQGLGYEVEKLQENRVTGKEIHEAAEYCQTLFWVRTPSWLQIPDEQMFSLLDLCKHGGIKTASIHLDKFWSIPEREFLIGKIPFWKTQFVFTADGSRQEDFAKRGVNHFWMRPAVSEVYCHPGTPREEYRCDVGFVGAKEYHSEYPFRRQMVEFMEKTYGPRFKRVEGVRGHLLNDAYASMKIVVGDCFQAGTPKYWSDRVPETCGRGGLLLHPVVEGMEYPCPLYAAQDLDALKHQIDWWLNTDDVSRKVVRENCMAHARKHDIWTVRMQEILETIAQ